MRYADNYDANPVLTCEGEVNPDTVGSYPLVATVTDSSGNSVTWDLTVNVIEKAKTSADAKPGDVIQIAPGTYDYSVYQGAQKIDTKAAGCMWWTAGSVTSAFNIIWWITAAV